MKKILMPLICMLGLFSNAQTPYLIIGTYDSPKSEGIYVYSFNQTDGTAKEISHVKTSNPSFITIAKNKKYLYAVNENADKNGKGGSVSSFEIDKKGILKFINQQSSEGNHPCYIVTDKTDKWLIAGNYSSGNFSILPIEKNGNVGKAKQIIQHEGSGPDTLRQKSPHVHSTFLNKNNKKLYVSDLGTDKLMCYDFDDQSGSVKPCDQKFIATEPGSGPRHISVSKNGEYIYLVKEIMGSISVFKNRKTGLKLLQTIFTLPAEYKGAAGSADIHISPDGKFLYVSNRADCNTIAIFKISEINGKLKLIAHQSTLGLTPRNFNFDASGKFLLVANQNSDEVVIFKRNINTGLLTDSGHRISVGKPVCLTWL
jgi:6-phosphogluconolactonase